LADLNKAADEAHPRGHSLVAELRAIIPVLIVKPALPLASVK